MTDGQGIAEADQDDELSGLLTGLGRAFGGALLFCLPMLMTMEMWELGFAMDRWRLLLLLLTSLPMLMFLSHYSGFEATWDWKEDLRDVAIAYGIGLVSSIVVLGVLAVIGPQMHASELIGKIVIHTIPGALGALLGRSQFGPNEDNEEKREQSYGSELGIMAAGALYLGLNVAPTEEMILIAFRMSSLQSLLLIGLSLLLMHGFVFASEFKGGSEVREDTRWWSEFMRFTVVGYAIALAISCYVLWTFGRLDGLSLSTSLYVLVVLSFPAAIGAAAARLIL
ncbi:MAG: putative integral rane protein [Devosia sp.]|jgi:putative integral membrane protein (TIGR02587 family)|nr:putative integral rane protein [Devosia sp.]